MLDEATIYSIDLISSHPNVRRGQPCIAGTGLRVADVVIAMQHHGQNPTGIAEWYGVTLAQVHAALSYYYQNQAQIDAAIAYQLTTAERLRDEHIANGGTPLLPR